MNIKFKTSLIVACTILVLASLSSCGIKRPLYLPGDSEIDKIKKKENIK